MWSVVDEVDRPEDVKVSDDDDSRDDDTKHTSSTWSAQRQCLERHPDGHEPIGADDDN